MTAEKGLENKKGGNTSGKTEVNFKVPCGYQVKEKIQTMDLFKAYELLTTKKQHHYTKAERVGDKALLYRHVLCCPDCGKEVPAYPHYLKQDYCAAPRKSRLVISAWAGIQQILFDAPNSTIQFQQPNCLDIEYTCEFCGGVSRQSLKEINVSIGCEDSSVYIEREIKGIKDIMELYWLPAISISANFPLKERVLFDFKTGVTDRKSVV